ncbi:MULTISPECIES: fimbrial protein [Klebsiella]|uniref:Fimbrial protein n=1 Tax=Klebsiella michiganensis TaxID=1134687 RepID=A0AB35PVQ3_9ENTR|nr:fimbrial protein [Klebsiella michiganensis]AID88423.1 fimbrial protein [Klebsiella oxytoca KONIH1]APM33228.1 fimbrial protein [Klebsiella oxytoca]AIE68748.1 fimbrial protein [Klebsiella michiganensis]AUV94191.1 fimbrial protein [Klebsiella oxytoca]ELG9971721.1 fimbrial protein [Klebsiella michiganensis]
MIKLMVYPFALLALSFGASAKECHLDDGRSGSLTLNNGVTTYPITFKTALGDQGSKKPELLTFDIQSSYALRTECDAGNDGFDFYAKTNPSATPTTVDGRALFPTNIEGIYYAVRIYTQAGGGGYLPEVNSSKDWVWVSGGNQSYWNNQQLKYSVTLYQDVPFQGNLNHDMRIYPKDSRTLGQIRVGSADSDDNNPWTINVNPSSFSILVMAATCSSAMVNNGTNNVNFGDVMFSSFREGYWPRTPFTLRLSGCNNTVWVRMKLATPKSELSATGGVTLMTNTLTGSDAATGVGVGLASNFTTADGFNLQPGLEIWSPSTSVSNSSSYDYSFDAWLSRTSGELKPGKFKAIGTFTIDYF